MLTKLIEDIMLVTTIMIIMRLRASLTFLAQTIYATKATKIIISMLTKYEVRENFGEAL